MQAREAAIPHVPAQPVPKRGGARFRSVLTDSNCVCLSKGKCRRLSAPDRSRISEPGPAELGLRFALPHFTPAERERLVLVQLHAGRWLTDGWVARLADRFAWVALVRSAKVAYGAGMLAEGLGPEDLADLFDEVGAGGRPTRPPQGRDCAALATSVVARWRCAVFHAPGADRFAKGSVGRTLAEHGVTAAERDAYFAEKATRSERKRVARRRRENEARRARRAAVREVPRVCHDCFAELATRPTGRRAERCAGCARAHKAALRAARKTRGPRGVVKPSGLSDIFSTSTGVEPNSSGAQGKP